MLLIRNAKIMTMKTQPIERGDILIQKGKIAEIGVDIKTEEICDVIDADGLLAVPGLIDAHCHLGMCDTGAAYDLRMVNEISDPVSPQLRAIDGFDPLSPSLKEAVRGGVTTIMTGPGSADIIGGQFAIFKTAGGKTAESLLVKAPAAVKAALGQNPMRLYGKEQKRAPFTRMSIAAQLREFLRKSQVYFTRTKACRPEEKPEFDEKMEAMLPVFNGEIPLKIHAHRAEDLLTAVRIAKEFSIPFTLDHCTEGHLIADELAKEVDCAIVGPFVYVADKQEAEHVSYSTAKALWEKGIKVAIASDWPVWPLDLFAVQAGIAGRCGIPTDELWKMITVNPAQILGIADRTGSLEEGKDADIVLFDGDPLRNLTATVQMAGYCSLS